MYPQLFEENITAVEYWANPFNAENSTIKRSFSVTVEKADVIAQIIDRGSSNTSTDYPPERDLIRL